MSVPGGYSGPTGIGQIAVTVSDVDRATLFYEKTLGLRLLFRAPPGLAFFDCGGVRLMLSRPEGEGAPERAGIIYYSVPDLTAAHVALLARGVEFVHPPHLIARMPDHELWMADFHDSEDNLLVLMSEVRLDDQAAG
jgi:methylmalonyl-CoA/ethylmalonyl-CoA epimerase